MTTEREEWAVRWPEGAVEECQSRWHAERVTRLHADAVLVRRVVTVGEWEEE